MLASLPLGAALDPWTRDPYASIHVFAGTLLLCAWSIQHFR